MKIISKAPKEYLLQGRSHCSVFTLRAILSAYQKGELKEPREYHISKFGKLTGGVFEKTFVKLLSQNGIVAKIKNARNKSDQEKIKTLQELLEKDKPVILLIGRGDKKDGSYSSLKAKLVGHWISLWGYNEKGFYVYDSAAKDKTNLPIGNTFYSFEKILRDWQGPWFPYKASFLYIEIEEVRE